MGSAMDLVHSGTKAIVLMSHTAHGVKKIIDKCTYPLTGEKVASMIITELVFFFSQFYSYKFKSF